MGVGTRLIQQGGGQLVFAHQPLGNCFKCGQMGHWRDSKSGRVQMVGQQQLYILAKGIVFDMQPPPPPAPCRHCNGGHREQQCPVCNTQWGPKETGTTLGQAPASWSYPECFSFPVLEYFTGFFSLPKNYGAGVREKRVGLRKPPPLKCLPRDPQPKGQPEAQRIWVGLERRWSQKTLTAPHQTETLLMPGRPMCYPPASTVPRDQPPPTPPPNHFEERLLDQAQARASYTPLFVGSFV